MKSNVKVVICLNGEKLSHYNFNKNDVFIACDGGYKYLIENGIEPNFVLGDFDSLGYIPDNAEVFSTDKNFTDGELALIKAKTLTPSLIEFICAGGGRDDQFFANVGLLEKAYNEGLSATMITNAGKIFYVRDKIAIKVKKDQIISLYPLENSIVETSLGLKYQYNMTELKRGESLGISNVATNDLVEVNLHKGAVLLFVNND